MTEEADLDSESLLALTVHVQIGRAVRTYNRELGQCVQLGQTMRGPTHLEKEQLSQDGCARSMAECAAGIVFPRAG